MPTRLAPALFGVAMVALGITFAAAAPSWSWQAPVRVAAGAAVVLAIQTGVRRHKPSGTIPWRLLAAAMALSSLGAAAVTAPPRVAGHVAWLPGAGRCLLLAAYPLLAVVLLRFAHDRTGGGRDRGGRLDAGRVSSRIDGCSAASPTAVYSGIRPSDARTSRSPVSPTRS